MALCLTYYILKDIARAGHLAEKMVMKSASQKLKGSLRACYLEQY